MKNLLIFTMIFLLSGCISTSDPQTDPGTGNNGNPPKIEETVQPTEPKDTSLFHEYKSDALKTLNNMTLEEKVGQMFLVRCPDEEQRDLYLSMKPGGFILFGKDFADKTKQQIIDDIRYYQANNSIPMIIGVDEEGGTVVRASSNPLLIEERFKSPQELYITGGLEAIKQDAEEKSKFLLNLGINLNLAPVADVSINETDFIHQRAFGKSAPETGEYVKTVVSAMKHSGISSTLKHFPGYGSNADTHTGSAYDTRPYEQFVNSDFIPFKEGIDSGAESILVSHNIVEAIDGELPASLSKNIIDILRNDMKFTGIVMTDDLSMEAITKIQTDLSPETTAVLAGNDMLIVTDFESSFKSLLNAVKTSSISEERIDESVLRILQWKYYMKLM
jgi:beta-N-acetylhexosaminidase